MADNLQQTLGIHGAGHEATIGGRDLVFVPLVQKMKDSFAEWVRKRARTAAIENQLELLDVARGKRSLVMDDKLEMEIDEREKLQFEIMSLERSAAEQLSIYADKRAAGHYEFHGRLCGEALSTTTGTAYCGYLMLKPRQSSITPDEALELLVEHPHEFENAMREVMSLGKQPLPGAKTATTPAGASE